jgi:hypothetical protein
MKSHFLTAAALLLAAVALPAAERETKTTAVTKITRTVVTDVTETVTKEKTAAPATVPLRVCVLDFSSIDIQGKERFLDEKNNKIEIPAQCTLNAEDRKSVNGVMQGFVRMIDAWDSSKTNSANRFTQVQDNERAYAHSRELYNKIVKGESRPMIIGAEYLSAYLGRRNDVFHCIDTAQMAAAMNKLQAEPDFPQDFMLKLARETGATHLIYGTVSDLRKKTNSFKGYGIETKTANYQLDVLIKVVDLARQQIVYSNVYTGNYREQSPVSEAQLDGNIFQSLMTAALEQAAEELYDLSKPGDKNRIGVTPLPFKLTVTPTGGFFFKPAEAEIYLDGVLAGRGGDVLTVPAGRHAVEIRAKGYKNKAFDVEISADTQLDPKLEK